MLTARLILAPDFLFIVIPLGRPGPQSPRRVSSWCRTLRISVTETQVVVSHPADVGASAPTGPQGTPAIRAGDNPPPAPRPPSPGFPASVPLRLPRHILVVNG